MNSGQRRTTITRITTLHNQWTWQGVHVEFCFAHPAVLIYIFVARRLDSVSKALLAVTSDTSCRRQCFVANRQRASNNLRICTSFLTSFSNSLFRRCNMAFYWKCFPKSTSTDAVLYILSICCFPDVPCSFIWRRRIISCLLIISRGDKCPHPTPGQETNPWSSAYIFGRQSPAILFAPSCYFITPKPMTL